MVTAGQDFDKGRTGANLNLAYSSQNPVDFFAPSQTGHRDTTGSAWEWTEDHFKRVNDQHGHGVGDEVIRRVARALNDSIRPMDLAARIGGEEFAVLLPNCPPAFGPQVAARVRRRVAQAQVALAAEQRSISVTVSVGGAFAPQWVRSTPAIWMQRADQQLYRAKAEGRDRVCFEATASPEVSAQERAMLLARPTRQDPE